MAKKSLIIFLISTILVGNFSSLAFVIPKVKAQGIPVMVTISTVQQMLMEQMTQQASGKFISKVVDQGLKVLLEMARKKLLNYFVDSIIKWVQGTDDKPAFVTDWRKFMGDVVDDAVGSYIETTKFAGICDTFDFKVRVSLPQSGRPALPTCTLNKIVGNIENFYSNFKNGGWLAFNETLYSQGNPYGSYIMALEGEVYEVVAAEMEKEQELSQTTGGFLNTKRCAWEFTDSETNEVTCLRWESTTPGVTISDRLQKALDVDIDNILSATEFTTYIGAILDAAINRLFRAGKDGLLGILTKDAPEELGTEGPTDMNYECDADVGACVMKVGGKFISEEECNTDCAKTSGVKYACETKTLTCMISPYGTYDSKEACDKGCKPSECVADIEYCTSPVMVRSWDNSGGNGLMVGVAYKPNQDSCTYFCGHYKDLWFGTDAAHSPTYSDSADNNAITDFCSFAGLTPPADGICNCTLSMLQVGDACFGAVPFTDCGVMINDGGRNIWACKTTNIPFCQP